MSYKIDYDIPVVVLDGKTIGKRIREWRKARGVSQEELGNAINSCQNSIHRVETGKRLASLDMLVRISNALDVSLDELLKDYRIVKKG